MADPVCIPRLFDHATAVGPGWYRTVSLAGRALKPTIQCKCGHLSGISLHHVHADGTVQASFFHSEQQKFMHNGKEYDQGAPGCGWHVFLKLLDYHDGEFPPEP